MLRFWNNDVLKNVEGMLQVIVDYVEAHPSALCYAPAPFSPAGRGKAGQPQ